jgi:hypothetical protein
VSVVFRFDNVLVLKIRHKFSKIKLSCNSFINFILCIKLNISYLYINMNIWVKGYKLSRFACVFSMLKKYVPDKDCFSVSYAKIN